MLKKTILISILLLIITRVFVSASTVKTDSLINILDTKVGIEKMEVLYKITQEYMKSSLEDAIKYANELMILSEEEEHLKYTDLASSLLGEAYFYLDDIDKSIEFFERFLEINKQQNDIDGIGTAYNNLGIVYRYIEKYETAIQYYLESLNIKEELKDTAGISSTQNNIGVIYFHIGDYQKALEYYTKSYKLEIILDNKSGIATSLLNIGEINSFLNNYEKALNYFNQSIAICEEIKDQHTLEVNYKCMYEMYKAQFNFQKSLNYYELYTELRNERLSQESRSEVAELEVQYETKKKEKEIELLNKQNQLGQIIIIILVIASLVFIFMLIVVRKQVQAKKIALELLSIKNKLVTEQSKSLEKLNTTKDKFFSIISHDLKGAIGGFLSQTDFLADDFENLSTEDMHELILSMKQSSKQLYILLENLLEWAKTQTGSIKVNPEKFNLLNLINDILPLYRDIFSEKKITPVINIEPKIEAFADINMISSVIRNLIVNAIKYSFSDSTFSIQAVKEKDDIKVIISDHGVGITKKDLQKLFKIDQSFSNPGTNKEKGSGLGLIICKEFIEMNNGEIWAESDKVDQSKGTSLIFTLESA